MKSQISSADSKIHKNEGRDDGRQGISRHLDFENIDVVSKRQKNRPSSLDHHQRDSIRSSPENFAKNRPHQA